MNASVFALAVLLVLPAALLRLLHWRDGARAWVVSGLAGAMFFAPVLLTPGAVPSGAAVLGHVAPWQAALDPEDGNPALADVTHQIHPWLILLHRELRSGRLPFWNPHQYLGAPYWANGQSAPLFPLHLLFVALPLQVGLVILPWLRIPIAGLGIFALARALGIGRTPALVAAVIYPLSGTFAAFVLYPMANALALVPWVLLAIERLATRHGSWRGLAVASGLLLYGGHPGTGVHTFLLAALYLAVRGLAVPGLPIAERLRTWGRFVAGWLTGAALAAIQLLPFVGYLPLTARYQESGQVAGPDFGAVLLESLRIVQPELHGNPADGTWWGPFPWQATAIYASAFLLPLVGAAIPGAWRDRRLRAVLVILAFCLLAAFQCPGLIDLIQHTPVLKRAPAHRLLFGAGLCFALLAARGGERITRGRGAAGASAGTFAALLLLVVTFAMKAAEWSEHGLLQARATSAVWVATATLCVAALSVMAARVGGLKTASGEVVIGLLAFLAAADLSVAGAGLHPALAFDHMTPRTGVVALLERQQRASEMPFRIAGTGSTLRPNAATALGIYDFRGDDTVKPATYNELFRAFGDVHPTFFTPIRQWPSGLMDRLAIRYVVAPPGATAPAGLEAAQLVYDHEDARLFERPEANDIVYWRHAGSPGSQGAEPRTLEIHLLAHRPGFWHLRWERSERASQGEATGGEVVVAESSLPGWRAVDEAGSELGLTATPEKLLAIALPEDATRKEGEVRLSYHPPGFAQGRVATLVALLALALWPRGRSALV